MRAQPPAPVLLAAALLVTSLAALPASAAAQDAVAVPEELPELPQPEDVGALLLLCEFLPQGCPELTVTLAEDCFGIAPAEVCRERFATVSAEGGELVVTVGECVDAFGTRNCATTDQEVLGAPEDIAGAGNATAVGEAVADALGGALGDQATDALPGAIPGALPALPPAPGALSAEAALPLVEALVQDVLEGAGLVPADPLDALAPLGNATNVTGLEDDGLLANITNATGAAGAPGR